ncbi:hypothetical protein [Colwellia sp. RSH04]|uniref:hypothetical protein n=1 Tax=Colwellia sp. RSH04 TaxID=2305464 RepID=UPI000E56855B|nr:hypothetical protein [Colwellia sp. RSH04]RHW76467.1 hypothetical protein D1094_09155 [Colwellia sp. RSH04]
MDLSAWLETQLKNKNWTIDDLVNESKLREEKELNKEKCELINKLNMQKLAPDVLKLKISNIEADISKRKENAGLGRATIYRVKKGKSKTSKQTIAKLERIFGELELLQATYYKESNYQDFAYCEVCCEYNSKQKHYNVFISLHKNKQNFNKPKENGCKVTVCIGCFNKNSYLPRLSCEKIFQLSYADIIGTIINIPEFSLEKLALLLSKHKVVFQRILQEKTNFINLSIAKELHIILLKHYLKNTTPPVLSQNCEIYAPFFDAVKTLGFEFNDGSETTNNRFRARRNKAILDQLSKFIGKPIPKFLETIQTSPCVTTKNGKRYLSLKKVIAESDLTTVLHFKGFFVTGTKFLSHQTFVNFIKCEDTRKAFSTASGKIHLNYTNKILEIGDYIDSPSYVTYKCPIFLQNCRGGGVACFPIYLNSEYQKPDFSEVLRVAWAIKAYTISFIYIGTNENGLFEIKGFMHRSILLSADSLDKSKIDFAFPKDYLEGCFRVSPKTT